MDSIEKLNLLVWIFLPLIAIPFRYNQNASSPSPGRNHHGGARCQENWLTNRSMGPSLPLFLARHVSDMLKLVECSILAVDPRVSQFTKTYGDKGNFIWSAGKLLGKIV